MRRTSHFRLPPIVYLLVLFAFICPLVAPADALATIVPTPTRTRTPTPTFGPETQGAQMSWSLYTLDDAKSFSQFGSHHFRLKLGQPRLAYGGDHLYYAWYSNGKWTYEVVDSARGVGAHASLAFDSKGMPNISYRDDLNKALKYARKVDQVWQVQTVVKGGVTGHTSIEMDAGDRPHITFITSTGLSYAAFGALGWEVEQVASNYDVGETITTETFALDRNGKPHVVFNAPKDTGLQYSVRESDGWHGEVLFFGLWSEGNGGDVALALYPNGDPYILVNQDSRDNWYHKLFHQVISAKRVDGAWTWQVENFNGAVSPVAIAIDADGTAAEHDQLDGLRCVGCARAGTRHRVRPASRRHIDADPDSDHNADRHCHRNRQSNGHAEPDCNRSRPADDHTHEHCAAHAQPDRVTDGIANAYANTRSTAG